jgi:hypothetical protein
LQHGPLSVNRRVYAIYVQESLAIFQWTVIASGRLDIGLEPSTETLGEHDVRADAEKGATEPAGRMTERIARTRRAGSKCIQRGSVIQAACAGRIVKAPGADMDIQRILRAREWEAQCEEGTDE